MSAEKPQASHVALPINTVQAIVDYLSLQPLREVRQLVEAVENTGHYVALQEGGAAQKSAKPPPRRGKTKPNGKAAQPSTD